MALGAVETGSMNAQDAVRAAGSMKNRGFTCTGSIEVNTDEYSQHRITLHIPNPQIVTKLQYGNDGINQSSSINQIATIQKVI